PPTAIETDSFLGGVGAEEEISFDIDSGDSVAFDVDAVEPEAPAIEAAPDFGAEAIAEAPTVVEFAPPPVAPPEPSAEELAEIDFYIEQELFEDASAKIDALMARYPEHPEIVARQERVAAAPPPPPAPAPAGTAKGAGEDIDTDLLAAIPEEEVSIPAPPPAAAPPPAPAAPVVSAKEENLFAEEDDFFDLAAELESELLEDQEPITAGEEEQSLEEIFKEFKKGVEQQLDSEDYDTHYNLGIAYKEMGLIDEAIGEFQLAAKDPKRAVECASMLGLCFLEKGMPQLAIKWYRKGLEIPEITEEEHIGLLYDLGNAYVEVGDTANAQKVFMEVYGMNTNYRDVISRIKQLQAAT
ncbi:MAG TPA: tetratricopeptide repeat protein, partial [Thermoanaerobaculia bacterium]|nr:tetratricopeptide repeat protein [Thermoanaerobaculia bacterium]